MNTPKLYTYDPRLEGFRELKGDNLHKALRSYLKIPDNPTNGDMIKALFPNQNFVCEDDDVCLKLDSCILCHFSKWWWNAPYCMKETN